MSIKVPRHTAGGYVLRDTSSGGYVVHSASGNHRIQPGAEAYLAKVWKRLNKAQAAAIRLSTGTISIEVIAVEDLLA